jgi:hypothetical protein
MLAKVEGNSMAIATEALTSFAYDGIEDSRARFTNKQA